METAGTLIAARYNGLRFVRKEEASMLQKAVLIAVFLTSVGLFYIVSPSWGCGVESICQITCYDAHGVQIGDPKQCTDRVVTGTGSCACETDYTGNGTAACHSHCTSLTGEDTYCTF